jgi:predicted nucleic-acid-binding protein
MRLLDTNILLRLFLEDDKPQVAAVEKLLERALRDKKTFFVADLAVAEMVWVLEKSQGFPPAVIAGVLRSALDDRQLHFENRDRLLSALTLYEYHGVDFIDAYQAALVQEKKLESVISFDHDFSRLPVRWDHPEKE